MYSLSSVHILTFILLRVTRCIFRNFNHASPLLDVERQSTNGRLCWTECAYAKASSVSVGNFPGLCDFFVQ